MSNTANWPLAMSGTKACQTISGLVKTCGHLIMKRHAIGWNLRVCLLDWQEWSRLLQAIQIIECETAVPALQFTHTCKHAFTHMQLKYFSEASVSSVFVLFPFEGRHWCFSSHVLGSDLRSEACQRFFREGLTISFTKILTDEAVSGWKYEIHVSPLIPLCCCFIIHHSFCLCWEASCKWLLLINSFGGGGGWYLAFG